MFSQSSGTGNSAGISGAGEEPELLSTRQRGTFCGVIEKHLLVACCPLSDGSCMWKHRQDGHCTFVDRELTINEFSARVGCVAPTGDVVNIVRTQMLSRLKTELLTPH